MKKKYPGITAAVLIMALALAACGAQDNKKDDAGGKAADYSTQLKKDIESYKGHVTLGEYKGIQISIDKSKYEVTQESVDSYINNIRKANGEPEELTSGTTKSGDTIRYDYSGTLDGVAFAGGTATDVEYTIGSKKLIDDLENGLVGLEVGKKYDIPCRFPDAYQSAELAGKDVIFTVTVHAIIETILPEYNDEFVKKIVEAGGYDTTARTAEGFTKYVQDKLKSDAEQSYKDEKYSLIWTEINKNTKVNGYPDEELKSVHETVIDNAKKEHSYYKTYYPELDTFEKYIKNMLGYADEAAFNEAAGEYAKNYLSEKMIITLIGDRENVTVSEEDITKQGEVIAKENEYASYQELIDKLGEKVKLEVGYSVLADRVTEILFSNAVEK